MTLPEPEFDPYSDPDIAAAVDEAMANLEGLPREKHGEVTRRLFAAVELSRTREDMSYIDTFLRSLALTARLHRNPDYVAALKRADENFERDMAEAIPFEEFLERIRPYTES